MSGRDSTYFLIPKVNMLRKRLQLGLIHVAVAMTLVPINSTLNRVMIYELAISATVVAVLASLPYVFSPIQVAIGSYSDRHPLFGLRRSPYILAGLLLCVLGLMIAPQVAFIMSSNFWLGALVGLLAFGAWGMGYNLASVSYLSLASELSGEDGRGKTIAVMWFMMIVSIILTAIAVGQMVDPYTPQALVQAFRRESVSQAIVGLMLAIAGGSFLYISASDLIPETHEEKGFVNAGFLLIGIISLYLLSKIING